MKFEPPFQLMFLFYKLDNLPLLYFRPPYFFFKRVKELHVNILEEKEICYTTQSGRHAYAREEGKRTSTAKRLLQRTRGRGRSTLHSQQIPKAAMPVEDDRRPSEWMGSISTETEDSAESKTLEFHSFHSCQETRRTKESKPKRRCSGKQALEDGHQSWSELPWRGERAVHPCGDNTRCHVYRANTRSR